MAEPEVQFTAWDVGSQAATPAEQALSRIELVISTLDGSTLAGAAFYWRRLCEAIPAPGSPASGKGEYGWIVRYTYATS